MQFSIVKYAFRETLRSRNLFWSYSFLIILLYIVEISFWRFLTNGNSISSYSSNDITIYVLWSILILQLTSMAGFTDMMAADIENGSIDRLFVVPVPVWLYYMQYALGQLLAKLLILSPFLGLALWYQGQLPNILALVLALVAATNINLFLTLILSSLAFKFRVVYSFVNIKDSLSLVLSGALIPLDMFNQHLQWLFNFLPFKYITFIPTKIASGQLPSNVLVYSYIVLLILLAIFIVMFNRLAKSNQGYTSNA